MPLESSTTHDAAFNTVLFVLFAIAMAYSIAIWLINIFVSLTVIFVVSVFCIMGILYIVYPKIFDISQIKPY